MYIKKRYPKNLSNILLSTLFLFGFSYTIIFADNYSVEEKNYLANASFFEIKERTNNGYIPLDDVILSDDNPDRMTYIVQQGDTLSKISDQFGTSISNIKKINGLKNDFISPGDKLVITEEDGIIYEMQNDMVLEDFAKKYSLDIDKLKELNYFSDNTVKLEKGDEIFLPINNETAIKIGLIETPKPTIQAVKNTASQTQNKPKNNTTKSTGPKRQKPQQSPKIEDNYSNDDDDGYQGTTIVAKRYYKPQVQNGFYQGHCTRYVAIKKFPYLDKGKQSRLWGGNGKAWYSNAKAAGYSVGKTPRAGSIIVMSTGGGRYYSYGHVGIVLDVDWNANKVLIEDMNAYGRFIVTKRRVPMNGRIIGYIYY